MAQENSSYQPRLWNEPRGNGDNWRGGGLPGEKKERALSLCLPRTLIGGLCGGFLNHLQHKLEIFHENSPHANDDKVVAGSDLTVHEER